MRVIEVAPPARPWEVAAPAWTAATAEPTLTKLLLASAAAFSAAAGVIHFAAVGEHAKAYPQAAAFFIAIGAFQVVWAALVVGRPTRLLYAAGAGASLLTIALWAVSRTSGLPFGPFAGVPEAVGRGDVICTVLEEALVLVTILLAFGVGEASVVDRLVYREGLEALVLVAVAATAWALTGMHGGAAHGLAGGHANLVAHLGHHGLHLLFAGGAVAVYGLYVVARVRRLGWPAFSWRLSAG